VRTNTRQYSSASGLPRATVRLFQTVEILVRKPEAATST